jgi:uroporphyrinogen-III decarboxylase
MNAEQQHAAVTALLQNLGAPTESAAIMASQLLKRARQLALEQSIAEPEALQQLLNKIIEARSN